MAQNPFVPNLAGKVDPVVERAIRELYTKVHQLSNHPALSDKPVPQTQPAPSKSAAITGPLGPAGNSPFPQTPQIPVLNDIPPTGSPYNINGTFILVNKVPYIFYGNTWVTFPPA